MAFSWSDRVKLLQFRVERQIVVMRCASVMPSLVDAPGIDHCFGLVTWDICSGHVRQEPDSRTSVQTCAHRHWQRVLASHDARLAQFVVLRQSDAGSSHMNQRLLAQAACAVEGRSANSRWLGEAAGRPSRRGIGSAHRLCVPNLKLGLQPVHRMAPLGGHRPANSVLIPEQPHLIDGLIRGHGV